MKAEQNYKLSDLFVDDLTLSEPDIVHIQSALEVASRSLKVEQNASFDGRTASQIYAEAGTLLLARSDGARLALGLGSRCPPELYDTHVPLVLRCRSLVKLKLRDRLTAEVQRLLALEPSDPNRDRAAIGFARVGGVLAKVDPVGFRLHDELWGPIASTWLEKLETLPTGDFESLISDRFVEYLCKIRQAGPEEVTEMKRLLSWSFAEISYFGYMSRSKIELTLAARNSEVLSEINKNWPDSWSELMSLKLKTDAAPLADLMQHRKGIVVLQSHSGRRGFVSSTLGRLNGGLTMVGKYADRNNSENPTHLTTADTAKLPFEFLKLAKRLRKEPRITRIFPDGGDGRELREIDLFGVKVAIGMGGSLLAYYGKSQLVFAKTRWTGAGWQVDFDIGPDIAYATSLQEADQIFLEYYAANLRKILLGPVIDICGAGGFVAMLRQALQ